MRVTVRLSGSLAQRLGTRQALDLAPGATVADLLDAVARSAGVACDATQTLAVVAGGTAAAHPHLVDLPPVGRNRLPAPLELALRNAAGRVGRGFFFPRGAEASRDS